jgi:peptide deformylase
MLQRLQDTRVYYQYPSFSAPQIGWNVSVFVLFDGSVWINPEIVQTQQDTAAPDTCWTWEPCASCCFLMHYIERPQRVVISAYNEHGQKVEEELSGMKGRMAQHEMDHLRGVLFSRRIPDALHVVPLDGFHTMSAWRDDFPSLEARSTNLYTLYVPPLTLQPEALPESNLLKRHYEDQVYPGHRAVQRQNAEEAQQMETIRAYIKSERLAGRWDGSQFKKQRAERQAAAEARRAAAS